MAIVLPGFPCGIAVPADICVTMYGGGKLCLPSLGGGVQDPFTQAMLLLKEIGVAFQPMIPVLRLVVLATDQAEVIKHLIPGPDFDPIAAANFQVKVVNDLVDVAALAPAVAFPLMLLEYVRALEFFLIQLRAKILTLIALQASITAAINRATALGSASMFDSATCAMNNINSKIAFLIASLGPIATIMATINGVFCLIGLPPLAPLPTIDPADLAAAIVPLTVAIDFLHTLTFPTLPIAPFKC